MGVASGPVNFSLVVGNYDVVVFSIRFSFTDISHLWAPNGPEVPR